MRALPKGWAEVELGEVWHESRARARPDAITRTDYIGLEHVEGGTNRITGAGRSDGVKSAVAVFSAGDILYGRLRPYLNKVIRPPFAGVASTEFLVFKESKALVNGLLMRLLSSSDLVAYANANSAGVNLPRISAKRLAEYRFGLAPVPEQHRIVTKIESLFARLDEGVAALKRAEANLERYRASVLKAAVEGRLTEQWRKENPPTETGEDLLRRILAERRKRWEAGQIAKFEAKGRKLPRNWRAKYKEPVAPDTSGLPGLPEGWCWATVDMLIREPLRNGKSAKASKDGTGVRTLTLSAVTEGDFSEHNTKVTIADLDTVRGLWLEPEDILVERANTPELVGLACMYQGPEDYAVFPDLLIRVRCVRRVAAAFVELSLQSPDARSYLRKRARGSAGSMPKISQGMLAELTLPVPPRSEQDEIMRRFGSLVTTAAELLSGKVTMATRRVATLRQSILKRAFEGRLVPQDPAEEPASVLLDRIRAERAAERKRRKHRPAKPRSRQRSRVR